MTEERVRELIDENKGMGFIGMVVVGFLLMQTCSHEDRINNLEHQGPVRVEKVGK